MMIPTIDVSPLLDGDRHDRRDTSSVVEEITRAAEDVGFFAVVGHGVPTELLAEMRAMTKALFAVSEADKQRQAIERDNYRGFIPLGFFTPNREEDDAGADRYEGFKLHTEVAADDPVCTLSAIYGPNKWADHPANMVDVVLEYWAACERLADALVAVFELALGLTTGDLARRFAHPVTNMTLLHYPPSAPDEDVHGIHPHKDTNVFTVLHPDPVGGLFVRTREREWVEATPASPDALLINVADMLEVWSGGRFVSAAHKVVNATGEERYAFPWFLVPSHDEIIEPLVTPVPGFARVEGVEVGPWSLEVWRTNWPDARPADAHTHLGTLDQITEASRPSP